MGRYLIAIISILIGAVLWELYGYPVPYSMDFYQFYYDLFAIAKGAPVYDVSSHLAFVPVNLGSNFSLNPPAYPPWYYLTFLPLGMISIESSARLWLYINVIFLAVSIVLFTYNLSPRARFPLLLAGITFGPFIGHLIVGQQTLIVLLGLGLVCFSMEKCSQIFRLIGFALLTYKPHLGAIIFAAILIWCMAYNRKLFVRFAVEFGIVLCVLQLLSVLFLHRAGIAEYIESLERLSALSINQTCDTCSSLAVLWQDWLFFSNQSLWGARVVVSCVLFLILTILSATASVNERMFLMLSVCVVTLVAPYIRNYDLVLLVAPFSYAYSESLNYSLSGNDSSRGKWGTFFVIFALLATTVGSLWIDRPWQSKFMWVASVLAFVAVFIPKVREQ